MLLSLSVNKGSKTLDRVGPTPNAKWRECMSKVMNELGQWIRPVIIYIAGVLVYNFFIVGNLIGIPGEFSSVKVDSKYKIVCNFELKNNGFITIGSGKIQLNIPKEATILTVDIPRQYKLLYKIVDGGETNNFAIFSIENLKGRESVKGSVIFFQFTKWEKDYINPISFSK